MRKRNVTILVVVFFAFALVTTPENAAGTIIQTATYNGHIYYLLDKGPWWDSFEDEAITLGGHLATINDLSENDFIFDTFGPTAAAANPSTPVSLFIGLNDVQQEGNFVWGGGEPLGFTNWSSGQPESRYSDEDYVGIAVNWQSSVENGKWHDIVSDTRYNDIPYAVVEIPEPPAGPVAYWSFDNASEPGHDDSGNGHDGTVNGATSIGGVCGKALNFDGDDYVDVASAAGLNPTSAITITAWFKANSFNYGSYSWPNIVTKRDNDATSGYCMEIQAVYSNNPCAGFAVTLEGGDCGVPVGSGPFTPQLEENTWYFEACVYDGSAVTAYVGSAEQLPLVATSANCSGNIVPSSNNLWIGNAPIYGDRSFDGVVDEVRIYNRALTAAEIQNLYTTCPQPECSIADNFENGVIDTSKWAVGGGARGWHADQPIGTGSWEYSHQEIVASPDGYFQAHVWGPMSGNTYGAEAWIRTLDNFNDGKNHVINFTWEPGFLDYHNNGYFIQVTDGYIANPGNYYWMSGSMWPYGTTDPALAGTTDFLWTLSTTPPFSGFYFDNMPSIGKVSWSLEINSLGTARLYDSPDASGSILHEATLDPSRPWYIRFMVHDGTSAGYPAGDAWFKLYDFSATCEETEPAWSFVQISDTHIRTGKAPKVDERLCVAVYEINNEVSPKPDLILVTGDLANHSENAFYELYLDVIDSVKDKTYAVPGNHDRIGNSSLTKYDAYINSSRPAGTTEFINSNNYYFVHKEFLFIGLDSGGGNITGDGLTEDQNDYLWDVVDEDKSKIIFMHHPAIDVGNEHVIENYRDEFIKFCEEKNVQLALAGHTHEDHTFYANGFELPHNAQIINYPLFVQTPSTGATDGDSPAYRIIDVTSGTARPREVNSIDIKKHDHITCSVHSPANIHVYDSLGKHVGIVDGTEAERGIPNSFYLRHYVVDTNDGNEIFPEKVMIFDPCDDYLYEVVGSETGTYLLQIGSTEDGNETIFEANGIPTLLGAVHDYLIDWDLLAQGGDGVTLLVDSDGDGDFERTITSDSELTPEEFNIDPIADAGADQTAFVGTDCLAQVSLNGSDSNDPDGGELSYKWSLGGQEIAAGVNPTVELPLGVHTIELVVNDGIEDSEPDYVVMTVRDNTPPELTVSVTPNVLWPPNHKMVQISSSKVVSDNCDDLPIVTLISIVTNEGEETNTFDPTFDYSIGDGHTIDDIQMINGNIYLRAERSGKGTGRVYTLSYKAVDDSGNVAIRSATVTVPHNQP